MTNPVLELLDAFKTAGMADAEARKAAEAITAAVGEQTVTRADFFKESGEVRAEYRREIADVKSTLRVHNWMLGTLIAGIAWLVLRSFAAVP